MESLAAVLDRPLIVVAHPDDETVGCGALLQRMTSPAILFLTDGAPHDRAFWGLAAESRADYARLRRMEAQNALAGVQVRTLHGDVPDQELYLHLERATVMLEAAIEQHRPHAILSLAFEGGHPDHDACALLARFTADEHHLRLWEMPLYHRSREAMVTQRFLQAHGNEVRFAPSAEELSAKQAMVDCYVSQHRTLASFHAEEEWFRPAPRYDFRRPPHLGALNYEAWKFPMSGMEVAEAFHRFQSEQRKRKAA